MGNHLVGFAGNKAVELHFANGQRHDLVVVDSAGRTVWRWSDGRMFTQAHQTHVIAGGDTLHVQEQWEGDLPAGRYTVVATVRSMNFPIEQRAEFRL